MPKVRQSSFDEMDCKENNSDEKTTDSMSTESKQLTRRLSILGAESVDRGQWTGRFDFLMSMIAYAVGLGNVWRFPYLCFKNGGGSFLVVYGLFFSLSAVPIFIMEVTIGQYLQRGAMEMWNMCPLFKGVGIGNIVIAFMCISYFCVIISWSIFYMISSLSSTFPWETCDNYWNTKQCITGKENTTVLAGIINNLTLAGERTETSVEQFWERRVLMQSDSISNFGGIQWELLGIMFIAWLIIYFALWKGITQARKLVYFCALFPYFLLFVLLIRGITLPGAAKGISYYLIPNITKLGETSVWKDAGTQVFYSYGFVVFSILGYMSFVANKDISQIVKPGVGLAFQAYPEVASNLPLKQVWAFLFFLMITILGVDSQVCMMEGLFTAIEDVFPSILRRYKKISLGVTCLIFFIIGIPMVSYAGAYWLTLFDTYGASGIALLFVVFFEVIGLAWGFGANNVRNALKEMTGLGLSYCWTIVWKFVAPSVTMMLFFFCVVKYKPLKYPNGEEYPYWAEMFGFFLSSCSMVAIPLYALYFLFIARKNVPLKQKFIDGLHPKLQMQNGKAITSSSPREEQMDFINADRKMMPA
ncbi:unnamed protein product [Anisakis simplex]|uniref:Transporter n=1 Tax=Anisakis simplex TaxID=6269 RepID=A0A0M3JT08_ANISI|nr:unnamed protein product [Anisakis simplex]